MNGQLAAFMEIAVPMAICEIQGNGGPTDVDWSEARRFVSDLAEHGDVLLYGAGRKGQAADLASRLAHAVAVLSFCPGGVTTFGHHFETKTQAEQL